MGYSFIYIKNGFFFTYKILYIIWDFLNKFENVFSKYCYINNIFEKFYY